LCEDGNIYSFGQNHYGQLGVGHEECPHAIQLIESLHDVELIGCGSNHVLCKTKNNELYSWGHNASFQLGIGMNGANIQNFPVKCSFPNDIIVDIKCGHSHSIILTSNGDVFSCGNNLHGQLGKSTDNTIFQKIEDLSDIIRIECGLYHTMCIDSNNDLFVFGNNKFGQLGLGDTEDRFKPIRHPSLSNIIDISSGGWHTFIKKFNHEIYAFGRNDNTQLGIETGDEKQKIPIRVFKDNNQDIWFSNIQPKAKSARSVVWSTWLPSTKQ